MKKISLIILICGFVLIVGGGILFFISQEDNGEVTTGKENNDNKEVEESITKAWNGLYNSEETGWSIMIYTEDEKNAFFYAIKKNEDGTTSNIQKENVNILSLTNITYILDVTSTLNENPEIISETIDIKRNYEQITITANATKEDSLLNQISGTYMLYAIPYDKDFSVLEENMK